MKTTRLCRGAVDDAGDPSKLQIKLPTDSSRRGRWREQTIRRKKTMTLRYMRRLLATAAMGAIVLTPTTGCGPTRREPNQKTHAVDEHPRPVKG